MKIIVLSSLVLCTPLSAQNLFKNGTMDTAGGWKGDGKMMKDDAVEDESVKQGDKEPPNRFLLLGAKKNGPVAFKQEIDTRGFIGVALKFCYKTKDYKGPGLEIRGKRMDGSFTFTNKDLVADGEWHQMSWVYTQVGGSKEIDFSFILVQGEGEVAFDNVSAEATK